MGSLSVPSVMKAAVNAAFTAVSPSCSSQGVSPAGDNFRARENIVGTSGRVAGFTYQQR